MNKEKLVASIYAGGLSGLLLTFSYPGFGLYYLAWIAFVPLMQNSLQKSPKEAFTTGYIAGITHFLTLLYWIVPTLHIYGYLNIVLCIPILFFLCAYLALYFGVFSFILQKFNKFPVLFLVFAPAFWVSLEYIRTKAFSGFPWELLGYSQYNFLHIIQIADITGVYGVSALIILCNAILSIVYMKFFSKNLTLKPLTLATASFLTICLVLSAWFYGDKKIHKYKNIHGNSTCVSIIQGNINQNQKWDSRFQTSSTIKYIKLSLAAASDKENKPNLIVWPETATPFYYLHNKRLTALVRKGIKESGTYFIIGTPSFKKSNDKFILFNSARLISPEGNPIKKYDKVHLVPFGEYVPFQKFIPFIKTLTEQSGNFSPGPSGVTLDTHNTKYGVQICYEVVFPGLSRKMVLNGADLLINITNDAWFGKGSAPYQHFSMVKFRAIENRRSLARSANTGISGFISPCGETIEASPIFEEKILTKNIPIVKTLTFYTKHGDIFVFYCFIASIVLIFCITKGKTVLKKIV